MQPGDQARHVPDAAAAARTIRAQVGASRAARSQAERASDDRARTERVLELTRELVPAGGVVACYLSREPEPGTLELVARLADDYRVLVPKISRTPDWAWYDPTCELVTGKFGIPEPAGPGLGADALAHADLVVAAAIAAGTDGSRIGTGGGWYDRALPARRPGVPVVVLLNNDEVRHCPQQPHDQPIDILVTPTRTLGALAT